jgi:hypothetical protein
MPHTVSLRPLPGAALLLASCAVAPPPEPPVGRADFNLAAQRLDLPLLWFSDDDGDGEPSPGEVAALRFFDSEVRWVEGGRFTPAFDEARRAIGGEVRRPGGEPPGVAREAERRRLVREELDAARPILVRAELGDLTPAERGFLEHAMAAGAWIDRLYALQLGIDKLEPRLPPDDPASRRLFRRNWGPWCVGPETQDEPACTAIPDAPQPSVDVYPAALEQQPDFCAALQARPDAEALVGPFTAVRQSGAELVAVPYSDAYPAEMAAAARELRAAAEALGEEEPALTAYLEAAARAFEDDDWFAADESWAAMSVRNARWYLRIAPDETYWEPCSLKAAFHATLARTDPGSLAWQERLDPLRDTMEQEIARLAGPPYVARHVEFELPDFLQLVANFGDDRAPVGGTAGQSLPNWGPVANTGRGRTMVVTNLGTDPDSRAERHEQLASLLDGDTLAAVSPRSPLAEAELLDTILHEASHNLGPAHEYEVGGRDDAEVFGGTLAATLEELKAQTFGQWLVEFLRSRGVIDDAAARENYVAATAWMLRHISRGMVTGDGTPRTYSQLAAIQLGFLLDDGAVGFDRQALAANGEDHGAFHLDFARLPAAWERLAREVGSIKAGGAAERARELQERYVEGDTVPFATIRERILRYPAQTFVYLGD